MPFGLLDKAKQAAAKFVKRTGTRFAESTSDAFSYFYDYGLRNIDKITPPGAKTVAESTKALWKEPINNFLASEKNIPQKVQKELRTFAQNAEFMQPDPEWQKLSIKDKITKAPAQSVYEWGPAVASSILSYGVNPAFGVAQTVGSTAEDLKNTGVEYGLSVEEAERRAIGPAVLVGAIDRIVPAKIFGGKKDAFVKPFAKRLYDGVVRAGFRSTEEAGTEVIQEMTQLAAEKTFRNDLGLDEVGARVAASAFMGVVAGGAFSSAVDAVSWSANKKFPIGLSIEDVSDPLMQEAQKMKAEGKVVDDFIETINPNASLAERGELLKIWKKANPTQSKPVSKVTRPLNETIEDAFRNYVNDRPITINKTLYRGQSVEGGTGGADFGKGLYFSTNKKLASQYGDLQKISPSQLPKNPLRFDSATKYEGFRAELMKAIGKKRESDFDGDYGKLIRSLGDYDGVIVGDGAIIVKYPENGSRFTQQELNTLFEQANETSVQAVSDLNLSVSQSNTDHTIRESLAGLREHKRADQSAVLSQIKNKGFVASGVNADTVVPVFRASTGPIRVGQMVSLNKNLVMQKYMRERPGSKLQTDYVKIKDLVQTDGFASDFVYAPKGEKKVKRKIPIDVGALQLAELKATKKDMLDAFIAQNKDIIAAQLEANIYAKDKSFNEKVFAGLRNNPSYRKEKSVTDAIADGVLMIKNNRRQIVEQQDVASYQEKGYQQIASIDEYANEAGYESAYDYLVDMENVSDIQTNERKLSEQMLLETNKSYREVVSELASRKTDLQGEKVTKERFLTELGKTVRASMRRRKVVAARDFFGLSDRELKQISRKDPAYMTDAQFETFMYDIEAKAALYAQTLEKRNELVALIKEKDLQKTENFRKLLKLPTIDKMSDEQLDFFIDTLGTYKNGDTFLPVRRMEALQKTEMQGVRTWREVLEILSEKTGVTPERLQEMSAGQFDKFLNDSLLAQKNPVYQMMVEMFYEQEALRLITVNTYRQEVDALAKAARKSRKQTVGGKLAPTDDKVIEWLESENKDVVAQDMTKEELEFALYLKANWAKMYDYLLKTEALHNGRDNYYAHIRRGPIEAIKDDGIIEAFREITKSAEVDRLALQITDGKTGEILAFEKFFGNAQKRTGKLVPTRNAARSFLTYVENFERKKMLDQVTPTIDTYINAVLPRDRTEAGLIMDDSIAKFFKAWLNNKRGRKHDFGAVPVGGTIDRGIRFLRTLTTIKDLGFSLTSGSAAFVGEQLATFKTLGAKKMALGKSRRLTKQGKSIIKKYEGYVGEPLFRELQNTSKGVGDKLMTAMFSMFGASARMANIDYLLGSMTKSEFNSGEISPKRLGQLRIEIGTFRQMPGMASVLGSTSIGSAAFQYKGWAIPLLTQTANNYKSLINDIRKGRFGDLFSSKAFKQELRGALATSLGVIGVSQLVNKYEDDENILGQLIRKVEREITTLYGALDPQMILAVPRILTFLEDAGQAVSELARLERYADGRLKSPKSLERLLIPGAVRQFQKNELSTKEKAKAVADEVKSMIKGGQITEEEGARVLSDELRSIMRQEKDSAMNKVYDKIKREDQETVVEKIKEVMRDGVLTQEEGIKVLTKYLKAKESERLKVNI